MPRALTEKQKKTLEKFEPQLKSACQRADLEGAKTAIQVIQEAFLEDRDHFRVLRAKNWYFEALLDAGHTKEAKRGFESICLRASKNTRIHLEATTFLALCALRLRDVKSAKALIEYVILHTNKIRSDERRQQYELRLIERIENEYILSQLIGLNIKALVPEDIHKLAIDMIQRPEDEMFESIGDCLPISTGARLKEVKDYSINLLLPDDQKLLTGSREIPLKREIGKKALKALRRISWRTFCEESSEIHKLWSQKIPTVFGSGYFTTSIVLTLTQWKIGIPHLAAGLVATAMKYTCKDFCETHRPKGLMIPQDERT